MKSHIWFTSLTLAVIAVWPTTANSQYGGSSSGVYSNRRPDYYTNPRLSDTIIRNRLERRRLEERLRQKRGGKSGRRTKTSAKRGAARKIGASSTKPAPAPLPRYAIETRRDPYQDFHREDANGFKTIYTFTSVATGKTLTKSGYCKLYDTGDDLEGVPAGVYTVRAEVFYGGKKYPAHIGSKIGSDDNPRGGDFAPTFRITLKPMIDYGGSRVMGVSPTKIYVRVLE